MKRLLAMGLSAAWLACATAGAWAQSPVPEDDRADAQRELAEAQRQLEQAAREVARLSAKISGPLVQEIRRIHVGAPDRPMLGVNIGRSEPGTEGVRVLSVSPGGPAAEAGVLAGDLIVALGDRKLRTNRDLIVGMQALEAGEKVKLGVVRGGERKDVYVEPRPAEELLFLGEPGMHGLPPPGAHGLPGMLRGAHFAHFLLGPWGDAEFLAVTPGLGRYFGTDKGLLVVRPPEVAGGELQEGDVILAIGGREPQDPGHALRILASYQPGETVELVLMRDRKRRDVVLRIPDDAGAAASVPPLPPPPPRRD
jgi:S1-C subfamily serine protease